MPDIPRGAKKPQDRAAKAEAREENLTVPYNGVDYTIERAVADDVEFFELLAEMDERPFMLTKVVEMLLGKEQYAAFKDANRNEAGRVPIDCLQEFFTAADAAAGN